MSNIISKLRKIPVKILKRGNINNTSTLTAKRSRILNDKSSFHVKEAYKALRTNVVFAVPHEGSKRIIVTSALAGEGKSTNCLNLAISFAQTGAKVLIIDCDLRKPNVANLLNIPLTPGLSNVLANLNTIDSVIVHSDYANLDVIPSGDMPPNPAELLGSSSMEDTLNKLSETYEYIFLDTAPINVVTDTAVLSKMAHGVVVVVRQGRTDKENVTEAIKKLSFVEANIIGFVLNGKLTDVKMGYHYGRQTYYGTRKRTRYYRRGYYGAGSHTYSSYSYGYGRARKSDKEITKAK